MEESIEAPHAIENSTKVYIRTGDSNTPYDIADIKFGLKNIGRVRARKLFKAGIKDIKGVKKAKPADLSQLIGAKTALSIKEQVGQESRYRKKIPIGMRQLTDLTNWSTSQKSGSG